MAITIEELAAPTLVSIGDSDTAGTLVPGQTWYFRVVAVKGTGGTNQYLDSPWMTEVSWTVGAGKSAIDISWNAVAGADRYYVLATQVAGDYDETVQHQIISGYGQSGASFTWTGWFPSLFKYFWYRPSGVPNVIVEGGSAGTPLTFDDIYTADVAGGWNRVDRQRVKGSGTEPYVEDVGGVARPQLKNSYVIDATLTFGGAADCYFRQYNVDILLLGGLRTSNTYTKLFQLGARTGDAMGQEGCELRVRGTTNIELCGVCNIYASSLIQECGAGDSAWSRATTSDIWYPHTWKTENLTTNASATVAIVMSQIYGRWAGVGRNEVGINLRNVIIGAYSTGVAEGCSMSDGIIVHCSYAAIGIQYFSDGFPTYRRCSFLQVNGGDLMWANTQSVNRGAIFVDCIFQSAGQTNQDPYFITCYPYSTIYPGKLIFKHEFNPIFVDTAGNLIVGATVLLKDKDSNIIINDTTNGSGMLTGGAIEVVRRNIVADPSFTSTQSYKYLQWMIDQGYLIEDVRNPHTLRVYTYGLQIASVVMNIENKTVGTIIQASDPFITEPDEATVAAYTGIAVNHSTQTITLTQNHTIEELYDYLQYDYGHHLTDAAANPFTTSDGNNFTCIYNLVIDGCTLTADDCVIDCGAKALTMQNNADCTGIIRYSSGLSYVHLTVTGTVPTSKCAIFNSDTGAELMNEASDGEGEATEPFTHTANVPIAVRVRKSGYLNRAESDAITNRGFEAQMTQATDPNYDL